MYVYIYIPHTYIAYIYIYIQHIYIYIHIHIHIYIYACVFMYAYIHARLLQIADLMLDTSNFGATGLPLTKCPRQRVTSLNRLASKTETPASTAGVLCSAEATEQNSQDGVASG